LNSSQILFSVDLFCHQRELILFVQFPWDKFAYNFFWMLLWISFTAFPSILPFSPLSSLLTMLLLLLLLLPFLSFFFFVFSLSLLLLLLLLTVGRYGRGCVVFSFLHSLDRWRGFYGCWKHTNLLISEGTVAILCLNNFFSDLFWNLYVWYVISGIMTIILHVAISSMNIYAFGNEHNRLAFSCTIYWNANLKHSAF